MQAFLPSLEEEWSRLSLERGMRDIFPRTEEVSGLATPAVKNLLREMLYLYLTVLESTVSGALAPEGSIIEQSFIIGFPASNNEAEYEAVLAGLRAIITFGVMRLEVPCNSSLVVNQVSSEYVARDSRMAEYL